MSRVQAGFDLDRWTGILLFLPVPLVLLLFTRLPFGVIGSLALGVILMATHRRYARPVALGRASRRCLWCGGAIGAPDASPAGTGNRSAFTVAIQEPGAETHWRACSREHLRSLRAVLGWASRRRRFLRVGIMGAILVFVGGALFAALDRRSPLCPDDAVAFFRLAVAVCVLPLGWLGTRAGKPDPNVEAAPDGRSAPWAAGAGPGTIRSPFPVHLQALIGTVAVIWLFRLIGILWLVQGGVYLVRRLLPH